MLLDCNIEEDSWTARRSNQSFLKEISPDCLLEVLMLKLQYCGRWMRRTDSLEKTLMLRKIEGSRRGRQRMRYLDGITDLNGYEFEQAPEVGDRESWHATAHGITKSWTCLSDWTELNHIQLFSWKKLMLKSN